MVSWPDVSSYPVAPLNDWVSMPAVPETGTTRGRQKVLSLNILHYNFFHNLYISETCILQWLLRVCCQYSIIV